MDVQIGQAAATVAFNKKESREHTEEMKTADRLFG